MERLADTNLNFIEIEEMEEEEDWEDFEESKHLPIVE